MILEHEIIEQVEVEAAGRTLEWVCALARQLGTIDPLTVLQQMWRAGYVSIRDDAGQEFQTWQCEHIWRDRDDGHDASVVATPLGIEWAHGQPPG